MYNNEKMLVGIIITYDKKVTFLRFKKRLWLEKNDWDFSCRGMLYFISL